jgi:hypothetical protein
MAKMNRVYSFNDASKMLPSQVETEIFNIVSSFNNHDSGIAKWGIISVGYGGLIRFTSSSGSLTTTFKYTINQFQIIPDSTDGIVIVGNASVSKSVNPSYGSGSGVLFIGNAQTNPSSDPTSGGIIYSDQGSLKARCSGGGHVVFAPQGVTSITNADSPYTTNAKDYHVLCNATSGAITVNLPLASASEARTVHIKKTDSSVNAVTVSRVSSDVIEAGTTYALAAQYNSVTLYSDGSVTWYIQSAT